jgi:inner membrane protein
LDNLTHTLTGLMLARSGLGKYAPRGALLLMLAANAPDIDVVSWLGGPLNYLRYHRGITHSLIAMPVVALLPIAIVWLIERKRLPWWNMFWLSLIGVGSHLVMDLTNSYGIRLFLPFSGRWLRLDMVNIVDVVIWGILIVATLAPALSRLVSSEIGARAATGRGWAIAALCLLSLYEFGRYLGHERAVATLNTRIYEGAAPLRTAAFPHALSPLAWNGLVETGNDYILLPVNLTTEFDPTVGHRFIKAEPGPAIEAARKTSTFRTFLNFSAFPLWRVTPVSDPEGGSKVEVFDLRFGNPSQPGFHAEAIVDASNRVLHSAFGFGRIHPR